MLKRVTIAVAVAACSAAAGAGAEDMRLKFSDLDLSQPAQARVLDARITASAKDWCDHQSLTGTRLHPLACQENARQELIFALPASTQKAYKSGMAAPMPTVQAAGPAAPTAAR